MQASDKLIRVLTLLGQATIVITITYAAWNLGGVKSNAISDVSMAACVALVLAMLVLALRKSARPVAVTLPCLALALIGFAVFQTVDWSVLSTSLTADTVSNTEDHFEHETVDAIQTGLLAHGRPSVENVETSTSLSTLPHLTKLAMTPLASALAIMIASAVFFDTRRSRQVFAFSLIANAMALVIWGFLQRAGGDAFILPGIPHTVKSIPFASFVYKNSGASALIPAITILGVWVCYQDRKRSSTDANHFGFFGSREARDGYRGSNQFFDVRNLILVSMLFFLIAGLMVSLCRGAWAAFAVSSILAIAINRRVRFTRGNLVAIAASIAIVLSLIWVANGGRATKNRVQDLSITRVAGDSRWSHWPDGWHTAMANFPLGSGLGTYRYATLPNQKGVHGSWYQHAHNQYLETFTETGIIGLAIVLTAIIWLGSHLFRRLHDGEDEDTRRWSMIGLVVLTTAVIHSVIDFVLVIPANTYLYAAVFGVTLTLAKSPQSSKQARSDRVPQWLTRHQMSLVSCATLVLLLFTASYMYAQRIADQALNSTKVSAIANGTESPDRNSVAQMIAAIDQAISIQPSDARLYRRRSNLRLLEMRLALLDLAEAEGTPATWDGTVPSRLFIGLNSLPNHDRVRLLNGFWADPAFAESVARASNDLVAALRLSPYNPNYYVSAARLATIMDQPCTAMTQTMSSLSNNSHQHLYTAGVIAHFSGKRDLAVDQWSRSLKIDEEHFESIFAIARLSAEPEVIVTQLTPAKRIYTVMRFLSERRDEDPNYDAASEQAIGTRLIAALEGREDLDASLKSIWTAKIHDRLGNVEESIAAWAVAVASDRRNSGNRYQYALALSRGGQTQAALDQASLASAIGEDDPRIDVLIRYLREQISPSVHRVRATSESTTF